MRLTGCHRDPHDPKDLIYRPTSGSLLGSSLDSDNREYCPAIRDQIASDCVAHATVGAVESLAAVMGKKLPTLSPLYSYANSRILNGQLLAGKLIDDGTNCRSMFKGASKETVRDSDGATIGFGLVPEADYPELADIINAIPTDDIYRKGQAITISSYSRIPEGIDAIAGLQNALLRKKFPTICCTVDETFENIGGTIYMGNDGSKILGGHCMLVVGYSSQANAFLIRNSWGINWGQDGYGWLNQGFVANHCYDMWVVEVLTP